MKCGVFPRNSPEIYCVYIHTYVHAHVHVYGACVHTQLNDFMSTQALLAFGCDVNSLNPDHCTPLDIALRSGTDVVDLLISVGGQTGYACS